MNRPLFSIARFTAAVAVVLAAGLSSPVYSLEISSTPLYLNGGVNPNFIMAIDDSNSMFKERSFEGGDVHLGWDVKTQNFFSAGNAEKINHVDPFDVPPGLEVQSYGGLYGDGQGASYFAGTSIPFLDNYGFARSSDVNRSYFNPTVTYSPWKKKDGELWPPANPAAARKDPRTGAYFPDHEVIYDLTNKAGRRDNLDEGFHFAQGTVLPKGTVYRTETSEDICHSENYTLPGTGGAWVELASDTTLAECLLNIATFPATFFLRDASSLPPDFGYIAPPQHVPDALGPGGAGLYKFEIRPENFTDVEAYNRAIQNFANWFQYHRNRFLATVAAMTDALVEIRGIRIGQFAINNLENVKMFDMDIASDRASLYDRITDFQSSALKDYKYKGSTPNRDAVDHIGKQYQRSDFEAPIQEACQLNTGLLFTDGYTNKGNGANIFGNADGSLKPPLSDSYSDTLADIVTKYYEGGGVPLRNGGKFVPGKVPVPASCGEKTADLRVDCETDLHMNFNAIAFGTEGLIYEVDAASTKDPFKNPPAWNSFGSPKLTDGPGAIDEIWHAALNGRGEFFNAKTPNDVSKAMKSVLSNSASSSFSGGSAGSSSRRDEGFLAYLPTYATEDWTGDITANAVNPDGSFATAVWSAAEVLEAMKPSERNVYYVEKGESLKEFNFSNLDDPAEELGLDPKNPYGVSMEDSVAYIRGDHSLEQRFPGGTLRNRSGRIGDIFGSQPEVLTTAGYGYSGLPLKDGGGVSGPNSYGQFLEDKKKRTPVLFVGANDGMLHAFNASAGADGGKEIFSLIPYSVMNKLGKLLDPNYQHTYFVDGSPVQGDAFDGSQWKTVLLTPTGAGGKSLVALDVTDPVSNFDKKNFLWEFSDPDLHETLGKPNIVLLKGGVWAAVFGSGVHTADPDDPANLAKAHIFVVNLFTGKLISKLHVNDAGNDPVFDDGFINVAPIDADFDLHADTIYAADYDGVLWRIDVGNDGTISIGNGGEPLFRSSETRPMLVTGGIDSFPHHIRGQMVFFGTGRYLENPSDTGLGVNVDAFFGIWDDPLKSGQTVKIADLQEQKILSESVVDGISFRNVEDNAVDWNKMRGWAMKFIVQGGTNTGERFIGQPVVALGKVIFPTYTPPMDACDSGGVNRLYTLSAISGVGEYDVQGEGVFAAATLDGSSAGAGPVLMPTLVATPPSPVCVPGSPGCPLLELDDNGNVTAAPSAGCRTALGVLLGDKLLDFSSVTCGRQSWQQVR